MRYNKSHIKLENKNLSRQVVPFLKVLIYGFQFYGLTCDLFISKFLSEPIPNNNPPFL